MKALLLFTFLSSQLTHTDSLLLQLHAHLDKSHYEQAFPMVSQLGTAEIQREKPMIYAEAQYLLSLSYAELGSRTLSKHTLDRLIVFLQNLESIPERFLLIARCYQLKADMDRDILDNGSLKENAEKLHFYYKKYDPEEPLYDAIYYAYLGYYYCNQAAFEDGFHFAAKAYDTYLKHKERAALIDDYVIYTSFCLAARNWWDAKRYGLEDNKFKFADTLETIINKRFPGKNMRKVLRIKDYANMMVDVVYNHFKTGSRLRQNQEAQQEFDKLFTLYDEAIQTMQELTKGKGHDYISKYQLLKYWMFLGKNDLQGILETSASARQAYPVPDFLEDGFVRNSKQIEDILMFMNVTMLKMESKDSIEDRNREKTLLIFEKLWEGKLMERIHSPADFISYMYNFSPHKEIFEYYFDKYMRTKETHFFEKAHQYDEKNRYSSYLFSLQMTAENKAVEEQLKAKRLAINLCLDSLYILDFLEKDAEAQQMRQNIKEKIQQYKSLEEKADLFKSAAIPTVKEIQKQLQPNEAHLTFMRNSYYADAINIAKFIITKDTFFALLRNVDNNFDFIVEQVGLFNASMATADLEEFSCLASYFYHYLMEDVEEKLPAHIDKLYILPLPALSDIPLELLINDYPSSKNFKNLPYLLKKYKFTYLLSSTIKELNAKRERVYGEEQMAIFAPSSFSETALTSLQYSEKRAEALATNFGATMYKQSKADKKHFFNALKDHRVVTLISHGRSTDFIEGINSGVFLHDGYADMEEVYDKETNVELLILNTCESGEGRRDRGEGTINLVRAFSFAGIPSIMASSWELDERSSLQILGDFFKNLQRGKDKSAALRDAKLSFLESCPPRLSSPYYWGSMRITGDDSPIPLENGQSFFWWWVLLAFLLFTTGTLWRYKGARKRI